jgi:peptidoglycan/xylan/chitin deacetylase (PgdA/CDA1 family)
VSATTFEGGRFVISLDFELHWGVADLYAVHQYRHNLLGVRRVVPQLLRLFEDHGVRATWAIVGMLLARTKDELVEACPFELPAYTRPALSTYRVLDEVGEDEASDPFHFGHSLAALVSQTPGQEIATHTFAHYFCLEEGQRIEQFTSDLRAAIAITRRNLGVDVRTIVFPRNQFGDEHVRVCAAHGIRAFRGTPRHWLYAPKPNAGDTAAHRIGRLTDAYLPMCRCTVDVPRLFDSAMVDVPASRFLRPASPRLAWLESLRARRICTEMEEAARTSAVYHLWWHPHNFGVNVQANLEFLERILLQYAALHRSQGMQSVSMIELADEFLSNPVC